MVLCVKIEKGKGLIRRRDVERAENDVVRRWGLQEDLDGFEALIVLAKDDTNNMCGAYKAG